MAKRVKSLILIFIILIGLIVLIGYFMMSSNSEKPETKLSDSTNVKEKFINTALCKSCHSNIDTLTSTGVHSKINCQTCHGAGSKHITNQKKHPLDRTNTREFCGKCHDKNTAHAKDSIKQVDLTKHNVNAKCVTCHNPHNPMQFKGAGKGNQEGGFSCLMCHEKIDKVKQKGKHHPVDCKSCHGQGVEHMQGPSKKNITKPSIRDACLKCHSNAASKGIKQIDNKEHNPDMKCIECHIAHNPLEFK
ncbi:MAG: hypothetical protein WCH34_00370 [Bacteroidota bacterium]